jgi:hypothetical protein
MAGNMDALKLQHADLWRECLQRARQSVAQYDDGGSDQIIAVAEDAFLKAMQRPGQSEPIES